MGEAVTPRQDMHPRDLPYAYRVTVEVAVRDEDTARNLAEALVHEALRRGGGHATGDVHWNELLYQYGRQST